MSTPTKTLVTRFIKLDQLIKKKEGEVEKLKEERGALEAELLPRFEQAGIASMKSTARVTVYVRRDLWASALEGDTVSLYAALKSLDETKDLVQEKVNAQTFSAYVRERARLQYGDEADGKSIADIMKALPDVLQGVTNVTEKYSLRTRKG